uniref:Putative lipocalin-7 1 n=1 Tax=Ixodes ricinus TaxID=34613 RepID=V5GLH5_IXORI
MKACIRVALAVLCVITSCNAEEQCNCQPEGILETISEVLEYRDAWPFLISPDTLYLMRLPVHPHIGAIQCVISTLKDKTPTFPTVHRWILYIDAILGDVWQKKLVTLTMQNKTASKSSSSFTTTDFPIFGTIVPRGVLVVLEVPDYIVILSSGFGGRTGCAWWVKEGAKDNPLWHCRLIFDLFCGVSYRPIYNKEACDHLNEEKKKSVIDFWENFSPCWP